MKKIRFIGKILLIAIIFCTLMPLMCSCGSSGDGGSIFSPKTTIDAKDYITINYGKYDGYSSPSISVDYEALSEKIEAEKFSSYINTLSPEVKWEMDMYDTRSNAFDITFAENYDNISNGNKIVVKIGIEPYLESEGLTLEKICNGFGIKFKDTEIEYTVSGLEKPKNVIDIFEGIENFIEYSGANGYGNTFSVKIPDDYSRQIDDIYLVKDGYGSVKVIHVNNNIGGFSYHIRGDKLSGGDTIELSVNYYNTVSELEKLGYIIPTTKKNVVVPDLGEYLASKEDLTDNLIERLKEEAAADSGAVEVCKLYCAKIKPGKELDHDIGTAITAIVKKSGFLSSGYYMYSAFDIIIKDGELSAKFEPITSWAKDSIEEVENSFSKSWKFELIKDYTQE